MKRRRIDWPAVAGKLAAAIPRDRMDQTVLGWAELNENSRRPWYVALSGGPDSVAVLLLLWSHWPKRRWLLRAIHFDHRLRGAASQRDATFCAALCRSLGVPLKTGVWARRGGGPVSEAEARQARMSYFQAQTEWLWLGHHQDDVAETLLMRLARGSGAGGLSAPRPVQEFSDKRVHLRPLLTVKKKEIVTALEEAGGYWRDDATNPRPDFFRNRVRSDVLPAWIAAAQRDAVSGAARSRQLLEEDDAALERWVDRLKAIGNNHVLLLSRLGHAPRAVVRRALHRWVLGCQPRVEISRQAFEVLLDAVELGRPFRHSIGRELFAVIDGGRLRIQDGIGKRKFQRPVN